jgi:hypothetical protein
VLQQLMTNVLKNPFIWGMALTYFFIYIVRQVSLVVGGGVVAVCCLTPELCRHVLICAVRLCIKAARSTHLARLSCHTPILIQHRTNTLPGRDLLVCVLPHQGEGCV